MMYLVESRSNIPSIYHAMWLAIVTMTTVGYGDYFPTSLASRSDRFGAEKHGKSMENACFGAVSSHFAGFFWSF